MYDLLLKHAHVVDPLNDLNGIADVAITDGKIAAVGPDLEGDAKETIDLSVGFTTRHHRQSRTPWNHVGIPLWSKNVGNERGNDLPGYGRSA